MLPKAHLTLHSRMFVKQLPYLTVSVFLLDQNLLFGSKCKVICVLRNRSLGLLLGSQT